MAQLEARQLELASEVAQTFTGRGEEVDAAVGQLPGFGF